MDRERTLARHRCAMARCKEARNMLHLKSRRGDAAVKPDDIRKVHSRFSLREEDVDADPIVQFQVWFDDAASSGVPEFNAMALATATTDGRPSVRMVLL